MKAKTNTDASQKDGGVKNKKLAHFKSPPRELEPDDTRIGDETPAPTNQGYAEDHILPNPADKTKKRSLGTVKENVRTTEP
ncbi:hypothetical protein [Flavobacterium sp.]